jgi:cystathionine beta-synthase
VFAALQVARELDETKLVVVLLPDTGRQYLSKTYSDSWMLQHGMLDRPDVVRVEEVLLTKHRELPPLITVGAHEKVRQAVDRLQQHGISQAPVVRDDSTDVSQFVGSIRDRELLDRIFRDPDALQADVAEVMAGPIAMVEFDDPIESAFSELEHGPAVLVTKAGQVLGVLTRSDLLDFLAHRQRTP